MESKTKHQKKSVIQYLVGLYAFEQQFKSQEDKGAKHLVGSGLFLEFILFVIIKISSS